MEHLLQHTKRFLLSLLLFSIGFTSFAQQQFPIKVESSTTLASTFLDDYTDPSTFRVLVKLRDLTETNYKLRLKVSFTSDNYSFQSINGIVLTLQGGETHTLDQTELTDLFSDLTFTTGTASRTLPEGVYIVRFEAFDAITPLLSCPTDSRTSL